LQAVDPLGEMFGFTNFDHGNIVAIWLHFVNKIVIVDDAQRRRMSREHRKSESTR